MFEGKISGTLKVLVVKDTTNLEISPCKIFYSYTVPLITCVFIDYRICEAFMKADGHISTLPSSDDKK